MALPNGIYVESVEAMTVAAVIVPAYQMGKPKRIVPVSVRETRSAVKIAVARKMESWSRIAVVSVVAMAVPVETAQGCFRAPVW